MDNFGNHDTFVAKWLSSRIQVLSRSLTFIAERPSSSKSALQRYPEVRDLAVESEYTDHIQTQMFKGKIKQYVLCIILYNIIRSISLKI